MIEDGCISYFWLLGSITSASTPSFFLTRLVVWVLTVSDSVFPLHSGVELLKVIR
eukprot:gene8060-5612_t